VKQVSFTVYGRPQPAGSKRAVKHPHTGQTMVIDANKAAGPWKQQVAGAAAAALPNGIMFEKGEPVLLRVAFYLARPLNHFGTGRNNGRLKDSAPAFPTVMPDATKLIRGLEDALTGVVWRDDAQVVIQHAEKRYALERERTEILVMEAL
jgi:Holliday junction resolvase RusA-like endonuclease